MSEKKIIYKYKTINDFTLDSLEKKYHYFSKPSQLNDPFDCRILLDETLGEDTYYELKICVDKKTRKQNKDYVINEIITKLEELLYEED